LNNLLTKVEIQQKGTLSCTIYRDDTAKIVLFGFARRLGIVAANGVGAAIIEILHAMRDGTCC